MRQGLKHKIEQEKKTIIKNEKIIKSEVKKLRTTRRIMSVPPCLATTLDSALHGDIISKYQNLQLDIENSIRNINLYYSELIENLRKIQAKKLLDKNTNATECVFVSEFVPRLKNCTQREKFEYVASCVRVAGEYAVAMRRRRLTNDKKISLFDKEENDRVFPFESRNEFVIDKSYPLIGFEEDAYGTTHAVFLTGLALGSDDVKGFRVAKLPALCLFDTPDTIAAMEFIGDCANMSVEQSVCVYDYSRGKDPLFSLSATHVDEMKRGWCNDGFSEKNGHVEEMNDISCFSECLDIFVNQNLDCCVTIESTATPLSRTSFSEGNDPSPLLKIDPLLEEINFFKDSRKKTLKRTLEKLEKNVVRYNSMWPPRLSKTARALMLDEAYAVSIAQQISHRISKSGIFEGMCSSKDYLGQRKKYVSGAPLNVYGTKEVLSDFSSSLILGEKRKWDGPPQKMFIKEDENGSPCSSSSEYIGIVPPSFVKMPNIKHLLNNFADCFEKTFCQMKNDRNVYQNMCVAINELREHLLSSHEKKASDLFGKVRMEQTNTSILDYESETFNTGEIFHEISQNSYSWNIKDADKTLLVATNIRRMCEETYAFGVLAEMLIFDKLRTLMEGSVMYENNDLAAIFNWYCTVIARNRICDTFHLILTSSEPLFEHFHENLCNNESVVSLIKNKIVDCLRWMMKIPSHKLEEFFSAPSKFVVPSLKINDGPISNEKTVKIPSHIIGPLFVHVDFGKIVGLEKIEFGKLFLNTVSKNGLLTIGQINSNVAHDATTSKEDPDTQDYEKTKTKKCGFELPEKLCNIIFTNRNAIRIIASLTKDEENLAGNCPTRIDVKILKNSTIVATCLMVRNSVCVNFKCQRMTGLRRLSKHRKQVNRRRDHLNVIGTLQKTVKSLQVLKSACQMKIAFYSKKAPRVKILGTKIGGRYSSPRE